MKYLINQIELFLNNAVIRQDLRKCRIYKGFNSMPDEVPSEGFPYIAIDDGGERIENLASSTQNRKYRVLVECAVLIQDPKRSLDAILDFSNEIKAQFELPANRLYDGHVWGIEIQPFIGAGKDKALYRARQVTIEFNQLEDRTGEF